MSTVQDPRKTWLATGSLLTVWCRMPVSGTEIGGVRCLPTLAFARLPLGLWWGRGGAWTQLASFPLVFTQSFVLWAGKGKFSLSLFFSSLGIPQIGLLSHVSSLRLSSGHSGPILTLRTDDAAHGSVSSPCSLVVDASIWGTSLLAVEVLLCWQLQLGAYPVGGFSSQLCCPLKFQNSPQTHPWEGFLLFGNFFTTPSPGLVSVAKSFVSLFVFYILSYLFQREWTAFLSAWCPLPAFSCFVEVAQHSNDLLICGGESGLPVLFLCHLGTTPQTFFFKLTALLIYGQRNLEG